MLDLTDIDTVLFEGEEGYFTIEEFEEKFGYGPSEADLCVHVSTGREWESEKTDEGFTIRTKPDPTLCLHEMGDGTHRTFLWAGPIAFLGFETESNPLTFVERILSGLEADYEGIKHVHVRSDTLGLTDEVHAIVTELVPSE